MKPLLFKILAILCIAIPAGTSSAQEQPAAQAEKQPAAPAVEGFTDTPLLPGDQWHVHDPNRPQPPVVVPGTASTPEKPGTPPSDAIVLFDGTDLSKWSNLKGEPAGWKVEDGVLTVVPKTGGFVTKQQFGDIQLHIEWSAPVPPTGEGQKRGNSGVFLMGRYEIQVLDSYQSKTYPDGQAAALYGMHPPLANACRPPGEWQSYDILFIAPRFAADGTLQSPAYATVFHNGVAVQVHSDFFGPSGYKSIRKYTPHPPTGPLSLQDHGNPVRYRNIWVRPLKIEGQP